jgi:hypothetical protein
MRNQKNRPNLFPQIPHRSKATSYATQTELQNLETTVRIRKTKPKTTPKAWPARTTACASLLGSQRCQIPASPNGPQKRPEACPHSESKPSKRKKTSFRQASKVIIPDDPDAKGPVKDPIAAKRSTSPPGSENIGRLNRFVQRLDSRPSRSGFRMAGSRATGIDPAEDRVITASTTTY